MMVISTNYLILYYAMLCDTISGFETADSFFVYKTGDDIMKSFFVSVDDKKWGAKKFSILKKKQSSKS